MRVEADSADVLVIGGGAAGTLASIKAREMGVDALVAKKSSVGSSTERSGGGFVLATEGYSEEDHFKDTLVCSRFICGEALVRVLAREAPTRLRELQDYGLKVSTSRGAASCMAMPPAGSELHRILRLRAADLGVRLMEDFLALELLVEDGSVKGVLGYRCKSGEPFLIRARAVVLATGGGAALYSRTDNHPSIMGGGYALAYRAGIPLRDMEFVQFYPLCISDKRWGADYKIVPPYLADVGVIRNVKGENLVEKHGLDVKPVAIKARDRLSRVIFQEVEHGNGVDESVLLDLTQVGDEGWSRDHASLMMRKSLRDVLQCDVKPILVSPMCHHFMGGVMIDAECQTEVKGVFAAGEVAGGVHGANRMGGNGLGEAVVFGAKAGINAAKYSLRPRGSLGGPLEVGKVFESRGRLSSGKTLTLARLEEMRRRLQATMWSYVGLVRDAVGLKHALDNLALMRSDLLTSTAEGPEGLSTLFELEDGVLVGEMVAGAALMRTESRGAHYRRDFPLENDVEWRMSLIIRRSDGVGTYAFQGK